MAKRFELVFKYCDEVDMMESPDGDYVLASDYDALEAERDLLLTVVGEYDHRRRGLEPGYSDTPLLDAWKRTQEDEQ